MSTDQLIARRKHVLSPSYGHFFDEILHLVKGEGMWLWDAEGRKYLDFYNNVPSVGHCHPHVVEALVKQASALNINTRYLDQSLIEFGEALTAKLPEHLDSCAFACSGTEANDLAVQVARHVTGAEGVLVAEYCYHGNSTLVLRLSTDSYPDDERPDWLAAFEVPDLYRGSFGEDDPDAGAKYLAQAIDRLDAMEARGHRLACLLLDSSFDAHGVVRAPDGFMDGLRAEVRKRGGLIVADEVQCGYCRMGTHWWGFQHYDLAPDIVTCGKPMGDGHPISVMVSTRDHAESFANKYGYFNTTGGNPVSSAVGRAVIEVIDREGLLERVTDSGVYLSERMAGLERKHGIVGKARGYGMFQGLDIVTDPGEKTPITKQQLRHLNTLIVGEGLITGTSGRHGNVLKLRPPLPATREHVDIAVAAIDRGLARFAETL